MYRIVKKEALKPTVILYEIEAPMVAKKAEPGQFIILRVDENADAAGGGGDAEAAVGREDDAGRVHVGQPALVAVI